MPHPKRRKSRRSVRCTLCTPNRWRGNSKGRFDAKTEAARKLAAHQIRREAD